MESRDEENPQVLRHEGNGQGKVIGTFMQDFNQEKCGVSHERTSAPEMFKALIFNQCSGRISGS